MRGKGPVERIGVDVDSVVADLLPSHHPSWRKAEVGWLGRYNREYGDFLTAREVESWTLSDFVKPECGRAVYKYLQDADLYDDIPEVPGAYQGVAALAEDFDIVYVTSCNKESVLPKVAWLERHGFLAFGDVCPIVPSPGRHPKKTVVSMDILIDDYVRNLDEVAQEGVDGVLLRSVAPYTHVTNTLHMVAENWTDVLWCVKEITRRRA